MSRTRRLREEVLHLLEDKGPANTVEIFDHLNGRARPRPIQRKRLYCLRLGTFASRSRYCYYLEGKKSRLPVIADIRGS